MSTQASAAGAPGPGPAPVQFTKEQFDQLLNSGIPNGSGGTILRIRGMLGEASTLGAEVCGLAREAAVGGAAVKSAVEEAILTLSPSWAEEKNLRNLEFRAVTAATEAAVAADTAQRRADFNAQERARRNQKIALGWHTLRNGAIGRPARNRGAFEEILIGACKAGAAVILVAGIGYFLVKYLSEGEVEITPAGAAGETLSGY